MSRILIALIFFVIIGSNAFSDVRSPQENHKVVYHIVNSAGVAVTGQTVKIKIQRASDGYWYDFNDATFKASGWTTKQATMSEDTTDKFYYYTFDPPSTETGSQEYLFVIDNTDATYADHRSALITYEDYSKFRGR